MGTKPIGTTKYKHMDIVSKEKRSEIMSKIKGKDTKPEKIVRSLLHAMGYRFRLHRKDLPGKPDIVLPKHKTVIFVHGCFWHGHNSCSRSNIPKSNSEYWIGKINRNIQRYNTNRALLVQKGWKVLVIWECQTKDREHLRLFLTEHLEGLYV
ncbi:MAG: very short patch repair endonuclease [Thermodesulfobacteriota bacterium]|nr:very short patch repair endonuclease [Thermodesulfobacteriota bacterium]